MQEYQEKILEHIEKHTDWNKLSQLRRAVVGERSWITPEETKTLGLELMANVLKRDDLDAPNEDSFCESGMLRAYIDREDEGLFTYGIKFVWDLNGSRIYRTDEGFTAFSDDEDLDDAEEIMIYEAPLHDELSADIIE